MNPRFRLIAAAAAFLGPICGASLAAAPTPPNGGTIAVEIKTADGDYDPSTPAFVGAIDDALAARGFTILDDPAHAAYSAELTLSHVDVGTGSAKVPHGHATVSPSGGAGVGPGISIPLSAGETTLVPLQRTRLDMRMRKRGEDGIVWSGGAVTVRAAGTPKGTDAAVAAALSAALLGAYPNQAPNIVTVP